MMRTILVVDDEAAARHVLRRVFSAEHRVVEAGSVAEARERLAAEQPAVVLLDYGLPGEDGMTLLDEIGGRADAPAVVMLTAIGSERLAVQAMKAGAYDYLAKPYDLEELRLVVNRAMERQDLRDEVIGLRAQLAGEGQFGRMVGISEPMRDLFRAAERVARTELPVLLMGESGTGKDLLAQELHIRGPRARNRLVAVNCAALPETLVESELFGYEKGAFTNALNAHPGKFEQAHRGTLFLDEIGDMPLPTQAKILRAVESGAVQRLGATRETPVDTRVISATNKELTSAVREKQFREDLYFRLAGVTLYLPPLRNRREDIAPLVARFWSDLERKYDRRGPDLRREALTHLEQLPWPGNVRQLRNTVERLFVMAAGDAVTSADVEQATAPPAGAAPSNAIDGPLATNDFREAKRLFEIEYLTRKLREHGGNVARTAAAIGFARQTLQEKIKELGIERAPV